MTEKRPSRWLRFLAPAAWYAVICFFSAQTGTESQEVSNGVLELFGYDIQSSLWALTLLLSFLIRKAAHMGVFFVLTGLLYWALKEFPLKRRGLWALGICAALAAVDECHQLFVPGRSGKWQDVCIDTLGGACFLVFLALIRWIIRRKRMKKTDG